MLSLARWYRLYLAIAFLALSAIASACGPLGARTPTAVAPSLTGRLLLLGQRGNRLTVYELVEGAATPQPMWSDLPGYLADTSTQLHTITPVLSPDGRYVILPGSYRLLDLTTGEHRPIPLPDGVSAGQLKTDFGAAFSPGGAYLAFTLPGRGQEAGKSGLYLVDLAGDTLKTLYEGPCANYTYGGITCGEVTYPVWIDDRTLLYNAYVGTMPREVTFPGVPELAANHAFVIADDGALIQEFDRTITVVGVGGATALIQVDDGWAWIERDDLRRGTLDFAPLSLAALPYPVLSPDGQFVFQRGEQATLTELRTGAAIQVEAPHLCRASAWSRDGKQIACLFGTQDELTLYSLNGQPEWPWLALKAPRTSTNLSTWQLIGWVSEMPAPAKTASPLQTRTRSPAPVSSPSPLPEAVVLYRSVNVRAGPGTDQPVVGGLVEGDRVSVLGRNAEGTWLRIQAKEGLLGWVSAELLEFAATQELPVVTPGP